MVNENVRHILGLSGGKDSTALAVLLHQEMPQMEYFFCDTHRELPETYEYLERIKARLGTKIHYLSANFCPPPPQLSIRQNPRPHTAYLLARI